ncbi:uncharacterized protein LOC100368562 [Saccoglossus kowalevskii]|uniref:RING-type E3 ubiquitin transferase n=1 Tax=Saccoglossus kowalevskii TaxID=10224 RepID=A0ABM0M2C1_SACKO|nr:PREDICTED: uncharacterized protein LOC100368562 [Saccoglossus kowalevskii]
MSTVTVHVSGFPWYTKVDSLEKCFKQKKNITINSLKLQDGRHGALVIFNSAQEAEYFSRQTLFFSGRQKLKLKLCTKVFKPQLTGILEPWVTGTLYEKLFLKVGEFNITMDNDEPCRITGDEEALSCVKKYVEDISTRIFENRGSGDYTMRNVVYISNIPDVNMSEDDLKKFVNEKSDQVVAVHRVGVMNENGLLLFETEKDARQFSKIPLYWNQSRLRARQCQKVFSSVTATAEPWTLVEMARIDKISKKYALRHEEMEDLTFTGTLEALRNMNEEVTERYIRGVSTGYGWNRTSRRNSMQSTQSTIYETDDEEIPYGSVTDRPSRSRRNSQLPRKPTTSMGFYHFDDEQERKGEMQLRLGNLYKSTLVKNFGPRTYTGLRQEVEADEDILFFISKTRYAELHDIETKYGVTITRDIGKYVITETPRKGNVLPHVAEAKESLVALIRSIVGELHQDSALWLREYSSNLPSLTLQNLVERINHEHTNVYVKLSSDNSRLIIHGDTKHVTAVRAEIDDYLRKLFHSSRDGRRISPKYKDNSRPFFIDFDDPSSRNIKLSDSGERELRYHLQTGYYKFRTIEGIEIMVKQGDITREPTDIIVNSTNDSLEHGGGLATTIVDIGGYDIQSESRNWILKHGRLNVGDNAVTHAGNLSCMFIIHAYGPTWSLHRKRCGDLSYQTVMNVLNAANRYHANSIAIPVISSGVPRHISAHAMYKAVLDFSSVCVYNRYLKKVTFIDIDSDVRDSLIIEFFKQTMASRYAYENTQNIDDLPSLPLYRSPGMICHDMATKTYQDHRPSKVLRRRAATTSSTNVDDWNSGNVLFTLVPELKSRLKAGTGSQCDMCEGDYTVVRSLTCCGYSICDSCATGHFNKYTKCPSCRKLLVKNVGDQPSDGRMAYYKEFASLPGYEECGTIVICYDIPDGYQGESHPHPGQRYMGLKRMAFLPNNREGRYVLELLKKAFAQRRLFTVWATNMRGRIDRVVLSVQHKTRRSGGSMGFGYPDPTYLRRVREELEDKGIFNKEVEIY